MSGQRLQELQASGTDHFRMIVESAHQGIWIFDTQSRTLYANSSLADMIDYSAEEVHKSTLFDFCFPEDISFAEERLSRSLQGQAETFDCRLRTSEGKLVWMLACTSPLRNEASEIIGVVGFFTDITNRHISEIALRESEKRFRVMADTAPIMMWISGKDTLGIYFNKHWLGFTGRSFIQELGNGWTESVHPDDHEVRMNTYMAAFDKHEPFEVEYRLRRYDGEYRCVLDRGAPRFTTEGDFMGYIGSCMDIGERKENEHKLSHLATIIESADDAIYSIDLDGVVTTWNKGAERVYGYVAQEMIGRKLADTIVPPDRLREIQKVYKKIQMEVPLNSFETKRIKKNGEQIETFVTISRIKDENKKTIGASVIARDITDKKSAQRERDALTVQLDELISIAPIGIAFINKDLQYIKINKMLSRINNKTVAEHLNKTPSEILSEPLATMITNNLRLVLKKKRVITFEYQGSPQDTERNNRWWVSTYYPIALGNGEYAVGALVQDITEQKLTERRKDDFISMASHELKTPVTTIKAFTQILQNVPDINAEKNADYLKKISSEVNRLTKLINDFLDVSKIRTGRLHIIKENFEFNELVEETVAAYNTLHKDFKIQVKDSPKRVIKADRSRIAQVICNLLDNAIKYSPYNKSIKITTDVLADGIKFSVQDKGIGISKENQARIFENFYRAFESEKIDYPGLGIGLYISAEIIKAHRGIIAVQSKKGEGSFFHFTLPLE